MASDKPKVEEVVDSEESTSEDEAAEASGAAEGAAGSSEAHKQSRGEKKSRKAFSKLGLKKLDGVVRVTVKRSKDMIFAISRPEVLKAGDTYVVIGDFTVDDPKQTLAMRAAEKFKETAAAAAAPGAAASSAASTSAPIAASASAKSEQPEDAGADLKEDDINLVMKQAKVSREEAVAALRNAKGDLVNAIMELSTR